MKDRRGVSTCSRRAFLGLSAGALLSSLHCGTSDTHSVNLDFPMELHDDLLRGHRVMDAVTFDQAEARKVDYLIVGAGIAGMSSALALKNRDLVVMELARRPGGSSAAWDHQGQPFAQGAHYELGYPQNYGSEALALLEGLGLIDYNENRRFWEFTDTQYLIDPAKENITYVNGKYRADPLPEGAGRTPELVQALRQFSGKMPMPTRLIAEAYRSYDQITFREFLKNLGLADDEALVQALSYQLKDDYGGGVDEVSALAGIHYYACRPYFEEEMRHFSPPQGNAYFIEKMGEAVGQERVKCGHLVTSIQPDGEGFKVSVLDLDNQAVLRYQAKQVIYAGQKRALAYTFPADGKRFAQNRYAPWLTVNLVVDETREDGYWQNEVITDETRFLGFVNSRAQHQPKDNTILTAYFCLPETAREQLRDLAPNRAEWVKRTLILVNKALGRRIDHKVKHAYLKPHGHAMPIPVPGYLFRDANEGRPFANLAYAGVDSGRLPLFFEAVDSGLMAVQALSK